MTTIKSGLGTGQFKIGLSSDRKSFYLTTGRMTDQGQYSTADLLAALDATANADAEAKLLEQYRRADKAEAKLADTERTLTELAPERDERVIAWEAVAKHEAFRTCYDEGRPLLNAVLGRIGALLDAEAERDALAATVERVREATAIWGDSQFRAAVLAALDPKPAFVLPTEAGVKFYGDHNGYPMEFHTYSNGSDALYVSDDGDIWTPLQMEQGDGPAGCRVSGPRITDAAVEAGARALDPDVFDASDDVPTVGFARADAREDARRVLTATLPHIRRAVIEELKAKAYQEWRDATDDEDADGKAATASHADDWLRAELEGGDRGREPVRR